jgi:GNAT superfamily N-acetyltransferase
MIRVRKASSDADFEAWRRVRIAVLPNERADSVEKLRRGDPPERLLLLAEFDGEVVGSGAAGRSDLPGLGFVAPRVLTEARRRGVGTTLLHALAEHVSALGFQEASAHVDDAGALAFAQRFGFEEFERQVEQVRTIEGDEAVPELPDGVKIVSLAERPELLRRTYFELALEAFEDFALADTLAVSLEDWERDWVSCPEGSFVALAGDEIVGCAGLIRDPDRADRAEHGLTAVRRDWRRRGLASVLKRMTIAWAAANGLEELYTWTQRGNEGMRGVNDHLGYVVRGRSISVRAPVPLR